GILLTDRSVANGGGRIGLTIRPLRAPPRRGWWSASRRGRRNLPPDPGPPPRKSARPARRGGGFPTAPRRGGSAWGARLWAGARLRYPEPDASEQDRIEDEGARTGRLRVERRRVAGRLRGRGGLADADVAAVDDAVGRSRARRVRASGRTSQREQVRSGAGLG